MKRVLFIVLLSSSVALAQDVELPVPKPKPTPVHVVTEKPEEPTPTPSPIPTLIPTTMFVTPPPVQQAVVPTQAPLPQPPPNMVPLPGAPPSAPPVPIRLYKVGSFPAGLRIKPAQVRTQGRVGSWLIGKFIVLGQEDEHHYTCQSHVDSIGIGIVDLANHIGGGPPITLKLYIVNPPQSGFPTEFSYGPDSPLKITEIHGKAGTIVVSAEDLTERSE